MEKNSCSEALVDPDPFTVVATAIAAASFALQLVETAKQRGKAERRELNHVEQGILLQALGALEEFERRINDVQKAIDKGSRDPDEQFYDAKFGVSLAVMKLELHWHGQYQNKLTELYSHLGALGMWVNHLIAQNPLVAAALGEEMAKECAGAADRINALVRTAGTNRQLLFEANGILHVYKKALQRLGGSAN